MVREFLHTVARRNDEQKNEALKISMQDSDTTACQWRTLLGLTALGLKCILHADDPLIINRFCKF